ncbi:MAG: thiamine diphosphokinase [Bacteroidia bacterium]|nr:thiamine diphosphokinase [Bacteroidia bacterium]
MEENIKKTVIVADGDFPFHQVPLDCLEKADIIICCDGSAESLLKAGKIPDEIVGDMDSLSDDLAVRFADRLYIDKNQETNDLTKAVNWCHESGYNDVVILGATGKREDHTLGNISLLAEYSEYLNVKMITDTGIFLPFHNNCKIKTRKGQQVSIFSINPETEITSSGLRYPLRKMKLRNWWRATLNEATGDVVKLEFEGGPVIVFLEF